MADPMVDQLDSDFDCEHLLSCFHDLTALDRECFRVLVESERSTVYRSVGRLVDAGIVQEFQRNYDQGGYYHVYRLADPDALADEFQGILNDWYAKMGGLIDEFRDEYAD
jgi:predicted transcriptional regulator